jgi:hypothetical protein
MFCRGIVMMKYSQLNDAVESRYSLTLGGRTMKTTMKPWTKSLKRALQKYFQAASTAWPEAYRMPAQGEIRQIVQENQDRLRGPVRRIGHSYRPGRLLLKGMALYAE